MGEPGPSHHRERNDPPRSEDEIGSREPVSPPPIPGEYERRPTPEAETYERDQQKRIDEEGPPVQDP
jgi:hypothetical protein